MHIHLFLPQPSRKALCTAETILAFTVLFTLWRASSIGLELHCIYRPSQDLSAVSVRPPGGQLPEMPMQDSLWNYCRKGLHYLETSSQTMPPGFMHPGGVAFGELGLSKIAVNDVRSKYPVFETISDEEVFSNPLVYERVARYYADLLLRHYAQLNYWELPQSEVFTVLQRAWFLGPCAYKKGKPTLPSREARSKEFMLSFAGL